MNEYPKFELRKLRSFNGKLLYGDYAWNELIRNDSIFILHEVAKLLGITSYIILPYLESYMDYDHRNPVFQTPDIVEYESKRKEAEEAYDKKQEDLVAHLNSLPEIIPVCDAGINEFYFKRTIAKYNKRKSHEIDCSFTLKVLKKNTQESFSFFLHPFISKNGKILRKKIQEYKHIILGTLNTYEDPVAVIEKLYNKQVELNDLLK